MSNWQPIETAPKDGTPILAFRPVVPIGQVVGYLTANGLFISAVGGWCLLPTHWQPLPDPPEPA
jgi:hypothetical protein